MPIFLRNYYLNKLIETRQKENKAEEEAAKPTSKKGVGKIKPGW